MRCQVSSCLLEQSGEYISRVLVLILSNVLAVLNGYIGDVVV